MELFYEESGNLRVQYPEGWMISIPNATPAELGINCSASKYSNAKIWRHVELLRDPC